MFDLSPDDLDLRILDCAAGPSSFNAELSQRGGNVVSCDPIYQFTGEQIESRIEENRDRYVWGSAQNPKAIVERRMDTMRRFLGDYPLGLRQGRYHAVGLPLLPFRMDSFGLALCSHFLFTYSQLLSLEFHILSVMELCRVGGEARIFPLLDISGEPSAHLKPFLEELESQGYHAQVRPVPYEFQIGGNEMLSVRSAQTE